MSSIPFRKGPSVRPKKPQPPSKNKSEQEAHSRQLERVEQLQQTLRMDQVRETWMIYMYQHCVSPTRTLRELLGRVGLLVTSEPNASMGLKALLSATILTSLRDMILRTNPHHVNVELESRYYRRDGGAQQIRDTDLTPALVRKLDQLLQASRSLSTKQAVYYIGSGVGTSSYHQGGSTPNMSFFGNEASQPTDFFKEQPMVIEEPVLRFTQYETFGPHASPQLAAYVSSDVPSKYRRRRYEGGLERILGGEPSQPEIPAEEYDQKLQLNHLRQSIQSNASFDAAHPLLAQTNVDQFDLCVSHERTVTADRVQIDTSHAKPTRQRYRITIGGFQLSWDIYQPEDSTQRKIRFEIECLHNLAALCYLKRPDDTRTSTSTFSVPPMFVDQMLALYVHELLSLSVLFYTWLNVDTTPGNPKSSHTGTSATATTTPTKSSLPQEDVEEDNTNNNNKKKDDPMQEDVDFDDEDEGEVVESDP